MNLDHDFSLIFNVGSTQRIGSLVPVYIPEGRPQGTSSSFMDDSPASSNLNAAEDTYTHYTLEITEKPPWHGYREEALPEKKHIRVFRNLRYHICSLYRRLFSLIFLVNLAVFIVYCIRGFNSQKISTALVANLFVSILMRQDYIINAWFFIFTSPPPSWPLWIRLLCARVYHIGGIHSGSSCSGIVWLCLLCGQATLEFMNHDLSLATLVLAYSTLSMLVGIAIFALPCLRSRHHNAFELVHRFAGWSSVLLFWAFSILLSNDYRPEGVSLADCLQKSPGFWLMVILTVSIILPWLRLRNHSVHTQVLSEHALRLQFDYVDPVPGSFTRMSTHPLLEWHSFATIKIPGEKGYSVIISNAGDWTRKQITNPPDKLWIRGVPTFGVLRIVPMFRRLVIVATGSGIAPVAPHLLARKTPIKLLWVSQDVCKTFGTGFVDLILDAAPDAILYNTSTHAKPDMVKLTYRLYQEYRAEAVAVISNSRLTQKLIYGLTSRGIPAFAPIFDS